MFLPTPHTPHPTPYTPHPTPYTLHPTPYTPHPTPHTPLPQPDFPKVTKPDILLNSRLSHQPDLVVVQCSLPRY
ncbi:MAG: hypothetical protein O9332_20950 [Microcystis sp. LE19-10.1B]|uniref:hypothetical protein n=1 Tax=Microcystis sp. LE19-10.1B TaxID=3016428 RepID=UPI0022C0047D|nr:hypothetical protein [Microcystis sp. LE19-10.1B]MCZ8027788.1 hypothetical protein [Microcystis sp. LE19-10.1B]